MSDSEISCHCCGSENVAEFDGFSRLARVTSDCKPWPAGGRLCWCRACGLVQKPVDDTWRKEVEVIYGAYSMYHQADGEEQTVFDAQLGGMMARSGRLLSHLEEQIGIPESGKLLDIGCGNGALLRSFAALRPKWSLAGHELNDRFREQIEDIDQVGSFFTGPLHRIPVEFDAITLLHSLEHMVDAESVLRQIAGLLAPGGVMLVQIPWFSRNPFDLVVADHCSHFSPSSVSNLLTRSGYSVVKVATDWIEKEISVVARPAEPTGGENSAEVSVEAVGEEVVAAAGWLDAMITRFREIGNSRPVGIFGTSIGASWLYGQFEERCQFFVDEDRNRIGRDYFGKPVWHPDDVPENAVVFVALPNQMARRIASKLVRPGVEYVLMPEE